MGAPTTAVEAIKACSNDQFIWKAAAKLGTLGAVLQTQTLDGDAMDDMEHDIEPHRAIARGTLTCSLYAFPGASCSAL